MNALTHNPLLLRAQRQSARLRRAPWALLAMITMLSLLVGAVGGIAAESSDSPAEIGTTLYWVFFVIAGWLVSASGAAMGAHGIASEHQGRTWEALLLTGMSPRRIVASKLVAAYVNVTLYTVALAPVATVAFVFGGVSALELALGFLFVLGLALLGVTFGLAVGAVVPQFGAVLALVASLPAYGFLGIGFVGTVGNFAVPRMWPSVNFSSTPVWWPALVARAPFGLEYMLYAWILPLYGLCAVGWLLFESAVAQVTEAGQDRLFSYKRALAICLSVWTFLCLIALAVTTTWDQVTAVLIGGISVLCAFAAHTLYLAADDVYPARRARHHLANASALRALFGPGVVRATILHLLLWMLSLVLVSVVGLWRAHGLAASTSDYGRLVGAMLCGDSYAIAFALASGGLMVLLRARRMPVLGARVITFVSIVAVSLAPWVLVAIVGGLTGDSRTLRVLAAPSPAYMITMIDELRAYNPDPNLIFGGVVMCAFYVLAAQVMFFVAARRSRAGLASELAYQRSVDERMAEEDAQAAAASEPGAQERDDA